MLPWPDPKPTIVHTQHDEIIIEARDGIEDQVREIVKESMEEAFRKDHFRGPFWGGDQSG